MLRRVILVATFIQLASISYAQYADAVLSKFFAVQLDETVFLRWTISAGNTCEDTRIERSADGISYERIGLIGGICGSPDQSITYEFTDTLPLVNKTAYYRIELGYYGYSSPQIVTFTRYNEQGFLLAPNPFSDFTRLAFDNNTGEEYTLIITDMQGRILEEMTTLKDQFIIQGKNFTSGVYFFQVSGMSRILYTGKLIIK